MSGSYRRWWYPTVCQAETTVRLLEVAIFKLISRIMFIKLRELFSESLQEGAL